MTLKNFLDNKNLADLSEIKEPITTLFQTYCAAVDKVAENKIWRIYNAIDHNRLITENYNKLENMHDLDKAEVVSVNILNQKTVNVYVRYTGEIEDPIYV